MKPNMQCRICACKELVKFLDLGNHPLANSFLKTKDQGEKTYPLQVAWCRECNLVQLLHIVDRDVLYREYIYFSSGVLKLSEHFRKYAEDMMQYVKRGDFIVEVASNDGILLKFFRDAGFEVQGIDPAINIAKIAEQMGVPTISDYFSEELADKINRKAKLIMANNVVAHTDDHHDMMRGVSKLLDEKGVFIIEAPYLADMFDNLTYDTIYHEHLSYLAVRPLKYLLEQHGLEIFEVEVHEIQGRSLRVFVGHEGVFKIQSSVHEYIDLELKLGLVKIDAYQELAARVIAQKAQLKALLGELSKTKKIAGYAASAKGNTLLNFCEIDCLEYTLDHMKAKQGLYTPGTHLPIVSAEYALENPPNYFLMLAWNYEKQILAKEKEYRDKGGKFIIPVEGIRII